MDLNLKAPPALRGAEADQIKQLHGYLNQMQRSLMLALDGVSVKAAEMVQQTQQKSPLPRNAVNKEQPRPGIHLPHMKGVDLPFRLRDNIPLGDDDQIGHL